MPAEARTLWRLQGAGNGLAALLALGAIGSFTGGRTLLLALGGTYLVLALTVIPDLRHRRWRYEVREQEIDIRRGTFGVTRTVVPMRRVQHVSTRRGVLEQLLELSTVVFHTAAGQTEIPALGQDEADQVRTRIATLARSADDL